MSQKFYTVTTHNIFVLLLNQEKKRAGIMGIRSIQQGSIHRVKQGEMADSKHVVSEPQHFEILGKSEERTS